MGPKLYFDPISHTHAGGVCTVFSQHPPSPQVWVAQRCACVHSMLHPAARTGHQNSTCTDPECTSPVIMYYQITLSRLSHHQYSVINWHAFSSCYTQSQFVVLPYIVKVYCIYQIFSMTIVFTLHIIRVLRGVVKYNKSVKLKIEQCA